MKNALILTLESEILLRLIAYSNRNGCSTSEDLFWKLDALQSFIHDLHWPDAEFARHLEQRLKLMACDMIESCIQRCYRLLSINFFFYIEKIQNKFFAYIQNGKRFPAVVEEGSHIQFDGLRAAGRTLRHGQRSTRCQATVFQTLRRWRSWCGNIISDCSFIHF